MSVDAASNKPEDIMDVNQAAVEQQLQAASVDRIVHGHTHRPARHAVGSASVSCSVTGQPRRVGTSGTRVTTYR